MKDLVYNTSNVLMRTALRLFAQWHIEGIDNVPPKGPLIVVANHLSNIDPPLLMSSMPRRLHFLAKQNLFRVPLAGLLLRIYGAYPTFRGHRDVEAILWARRLLRRDGTIVVFPEAHRNPDEGMQKGTPGVALLALRSQAPILPVGISGTEHIGPLWRIVVPTGRITVQIGQPFSLPVIEGKLSREQLQELTDTIMYRVAALIPPRHRGVYQLPSRHAATVKPKE